MVNYILQILCFIKYFINQFLFTTFSASGMSYLLKLDIEIIRSEHLSRYPAFKAWLQVTKWERVYKRNSTKP